MAPTVAARQARPVSTNSTAISGLAVFDSLVAALNDHDLERAYALYHPDAQHLGMPRRADGIKAVRAVDAEFFDAFPDHHRTIERVIEGDGLVAAWLRLTATHTRSLPGAPATGRRIDFELCNLVALRDGRIAWMRQCYDAMLVARQLTG